VVPYSEFKNTPPILNNINNNVIVPVIPISLINIYGGYSYSVYNKNNKYSLKRGMYVINSTGYYIGLLNYDKTNFVTYVGIISIISTGPDGHSYNYYKDTIIISVLGNFGYVTLDLFDNNGNINRLHNILSYSN
jgi:hypothetical protein